MSSAPDTSQGALALLGGDMPPPPFGALGVGRDGRLAWSERARLSFRFDALGASFHAEGRRRGDHVALDLAAELGPLPFSAEGKDRRNALRALVAGDDGRTELRLSLDRTGMLRLGGRLSVAEPVSPVAILVALTEAVLKVRPRLARVAALLAGA